LTETHATTTPDAEMFPPGRYGRRRAPGRRPTWLAALLLAVILAASTVLAVRLYRLYGDPDYDAQVITYTGITDTQILVDFQVTVPTGGSARFALRARSRDGAVVGRAEVQVAARPGEEQVSTRQLIRTRARPMIAEVVRCRAPG